MSTGAWESERVDGYLVLEHVGASYVVGGSLIVRSVVCPSYDFAQSELIRIAQYTSNVLSIVKVVSLASFQKV